MEGFSAKCKTTRTEVMDAKKSIGFASQDRILVAGKAV
jgi:hypothetical protein